MNLIHTSITLSQLFALRRELADAGCCAADGEVVEGLATVQKLRIGEANQVLYLCACNVILETPDGIPSRRVKAGLELTRGARSIRRYSVRVAGTERVTDESLWFTAVHATVRIDHAARAITLNLTDAVLVPVIDAKPRKYPLPNAPEAATPVRPTGLVFGAVVPYGAVAA